jgi:hypothetical protein
MKYLKAVIQVEYRRLGSINRPKRCIFTCSNLSREQEIPTILHILLALSIQVNTTRSGNSTKSVHESNGSNSCRHIFIYMYIYMESLPECSLSDFFLIFSNPT